MYQLTKKPLEYKTTSNVYYHPENPFKFPNMNFWRLENKKKWVRNDFSFWGFSSCQHFFFMFSSEGYFRKENC